MPLMIYWRSFHIYGLVLIIFHLFEQSSFFTGHKCVLMLRHGFGFNSNFKNLLNLEIFLFFCTGRCGVRLSSASLRYRVHPISRKLKGL